MDPDLPSTGNGEPDAPDKALVMQRCNKWIRVSSTETGEQAWIDLRQSGFATLLAAVERADS